MRRTTLKQHFALVTLFDLTAGQFLSDAKGAEDAVEAFSKASISLLRPSDDRPIEIPIHDDQVTPTLMCKVLSAWLLKGIFRRVDFLSWGPWLRGSVPVARSAPLTGASNSRRNA